MNAPIRSDARALLNRMIRSDGPWRALSVSKAELVVVHALIAAGLVSLVAGIYRPTDAGRAVVA